MAGKVKITKKYRGCFQKRNTCWRGHSSFEVHCKQQREKYTKYSALQWHYKNWSRSSCYLVQVAWRDHAFKELLSRAILKYNFYSGYSWYALTKFIASKSYKGFQIEERVEIKPVMLRCLFFNCGFAKFSKLSQIIKSFLNAKNLEFFCCHQVPKFHPKKTKININSGHAT
jgi:hypothetical protein